MANKTSFIIVICVFMLLPYQVNAQGGVSLEDLIFAPSSNPTPNHNTVTRPEIVKPTLPSPARPQVTPPVISKPKLDKPKALMSYRAPSTTPKPQVKPQIKTKLQSTVTTPAAGAATDAPPSQDTAKTLPAKTLPIVKDAVQPPAIIDEDVLIYPINQKDLGNSLSLQTKQWLDMNIVAALKTGKARKVMMTAYAKPTTIHEVSGRRIALSQGLLLREYLLSQGLTPEQTNLKAVSAGDNTPEGIAENRIEFFLQK